MATALIDRLNDALGWEMRALALYAHYAAYVGGIHRLHLKPYFEAEAAESMTHAGTVRAAIVKLGGVARTERDNTEIVHTNDYKTILAEALKTETVAAETYEEILGMDGLDQEMRDALEQVLFQEERSVEELHRMMDPRLTPPTDR